MEEPTNADLLVRIKLMEAQLEHIEDLVQRATGMWLLSKWIAGSLVTLAALWASIHDWWRQ